MSDVLVSARGIAAGYSSDDVISGITFDLHRGERVGILGPNGGGKTTLLKVLSGEIAPRAGSLSVDGTCAIVPQTDGSRTDYPVSALDVTTMGALPRLPWWRRPGRHERASAREALASVGLANRAKDTFGELSGGQRQRVLIARALMQRAEILLLDEPFTGLDASSAARLEDLVADLGGAGKSILIATHDLTQARRWDKVLCLNHRQVAYGDPQEALDRIAVERTYAWTS